MDWIRWERDIEHDVETIHVPLSMVKDIDPAHDAKPVKLCEQIRDKSEPDAALCKAFNRETRNGRDMRRQARLLRDAVGSIIEAKAENDIDNFFDGGTTSFLENDVEGLDDFELVCFLAVRTG